MMIKKRCVLFFAFFMMIAPVFAQDQDLFRVDDITVDVSAESGTQAREKAFNAATAEAFDVLTKRILSADKTDSFVAPEPEKIARLVKSFEITKERVASTRYAGTYTFHFDPNGVKRLLKQANVFAATEQSDPVLVLPFLKRGLATSLWNADNVWMHAWAGRAPNPQSVPLIVPIGDLDDVNDVRSSQIPALSATQLQPMQNRYSAKDILIAEAEMSDKLIQSNNSDDGLGGVLRVALYRFENNMPVEFEQFSLSPEPGQTIKDVMHDAVSRVQQILNTDWKTKAIEKQRKIASAQTITVNVPIQSLRDWTEIQAILKTSAAVTDIEVLSLSPRMMSTKIAYYGTIDRLVFDLQQFGLVLQKQMPAGGDWGQVAPPETYLLMKQVMYDAQPKRRYSQTF